MKNFWHSNPVNRGDGADMPNLKTTLTYFAEILWYSSVH